MLSRPILCVFIIVIGAHPSIAQNDAVELYKMCSAKYGSADEVVCDAFAAGTMSGLAFGQAAVALGHRFCPPDNLSAIQAGLIIRKYLLNHPGALNEHAGMVASMALLEAFPCKNSN
jgi:Rap1a immunity proteins